MVREGGAQRETMFINNSYGVRPKYCNAYCMFNGHKREKEALDKDLHVTEFKETDPTERITLRTNEPRTRRQAEREAETGPLLLF